MSTVVGKDAKPCDPKGEKKEELEERGGERRRELQQSIEGGGRLQTKTRNSFGGFGGIVR